MERKGGFPGAKTMTMSIFLDPEAKKEKQKAYRKTPRKIAETSSGWNERSFKSMEEVLPKA